jgi:acetyl esterase
MTLDPQARAHLDKLSSLNLPGFHTMPPEEARRLFRVMRGLSGKPDPVELVEDIITSVTVPLRLYRPLGSGSGPLPALVYYHGGGWVLGDLETVDNLCRRLANASGCVVVSVAYRLSPESKFPGPLEDCYEAARFLWVDSRDADDLGIDPTRIAVGGDSAGGNLAAGVARLALDRGSPPIRYQLLIYPITDFRFDTPSYLENAEGYGLGREMMRWYWDQYLASPEDGASPLASPLRAEDLSGLPPALVVTAGYDVLRDEGLAYADRLKEAGVPVEVQHYPGMIHGFFQMADSFDEGMRAISEAGRALMSSLKP